MTHFKGKRGGLLKNLRDTCRSRLRTLAHSLSAAVSLEAWRRRLPRGRVQFFRRPPLLPLTAITLLCLACGSAVNEGENYGNLLESPEGLTLTEPEHEIGWGRGDCTTCHNLENIHLVDRTGGVVDTEAVHDQALEEGVTGCADCHGTNGVD